MAMKNQVDNALILTIGAISGILIVVISIGLQAWFIHEEHTELAFKWQSSVNVELRDLRQEQTAKIGTYHWVNREHTVAAIPVKDAMDLMVQMNGKLSSTQPIK